ncbi:hypothetical protein AB6A40_004187 [Gnathostoma spinigerum]|uniref:Uncharacterized protein n=1 Tax=Gnathostoma spinigerum TaxID=75299 RepID=A0ABD6EBX7_9BILA
MGRACAENTNMAEYSSVSDGILSYMCSLAVEKCSKKEERKKASCGGDAMRRRLLIRNFVSHMLEKQNTCDDEKDIELILAKHDVSVEEDDENTEDETSTEETEYCDYSELSMCPPSTSVFLEHWLQLGCLPSAVLSDSLFEDENSSKRDADDSDKDQTASASGGLEEDIEMSRDFRINSHQNSNFADLKNINLLTPGGCREAESSVWRDGLLNSKKLVENPEALEEYESSVAKRSSNDDIAFVANLFVHSAKRFKCAF